MKYFGLQNQIWKNNSNSAIILLVFPLIFLGLTWLFLLFLSLSQGKETSLLIVDHSFFRTAPWVILGVIIWFTIAWFSHSAMINRATGSRPLTRKENTRVYNLVENLCISGGMAMPKIRIIDDDSLNAYASGLNSNSFSISLSSGIIDKLDDDELDAVIAHELTHIKNRDVRLLIVSIVFVGIFAFISETIFRSIQFGGVGRSKKGGGVMILVALALALVGYLIASLLRFSLSRNREYLADAGAAELTRRPKALASALRKVAADPTIEAVKRRDVAQLFLDNPKTRKAKRSVSFTSLFATHPPIDRRIELLEQY
jgi:heat shock protein HtpX